MFTPLSFGDVFTMDDEKDYIFLAPGDGVTYAALILDEQLSNTLDRTFNNKFAKGKETTNILYCYVKLQTKEFEDRCALVSNSGHDVLRNLKKQVVVLDQRDLDQLKDEILNGKGAPGELKDLIKKL